MNLCINARDAMPGGGQLRIEVENVTLDDQYARMNLDAKPGTACADYGCRHRVGDSARDH